MRPLAEFPLPFLPHQIPAGFGWEGRDFSDSESSTTTAFNNSIDKRDKFLGQKRCVICGGSRTLRHCYVIARTEQDTWTSLKDRGWIHPQAKNDPMYEPGNGFLLCATRRVAFNNYDFFIRFLPDVQKFVFINHSGDPDFEHFHGKAIALDIKDRHAPLPSLFIIHEMRVRGLHPFEGVSPALSDDIAWQDWISSGSLYDDITRSFKREMPPPNGNDTVAAQPQLHFPPTMMNTGATSLARTQWH